MTAPRAGRSDERWTVVVAVGLLLALAVYDAQRLSIWIDEAYSLDTAGRSLAHAWRRVISFELQPPLYYLLLHVWLKLNDSPLFARLFSALCAAGTIWVLMRQARDLGLKPGVASLPMIAALSPGMIWSATQIRGYALAILLAASANYWFTRGWITRSGRWPWAGLWYAGSAYLGLLTFYYIGFLLAAHFILGLRSAELRRRTIVTFTGLALALAPWLPTIFMQAGAHPNDVPPPNLLDSGPMDAIANLLKWGVRQVAEMPLTGDSVVHLRAPVLLIVVGAIVWLVAGRWLRGLERWGTADSAFLLMTVLPAGVLIVLAPWILVERRHLLFILPAMVTLLALLASRMGSSTTPLRVLLAVMALASVNYRIFMRAPNDFRSAVAHIEANAIPGEPIVFFRSVNVLAFRVYYRGSNPLAGLPGDYDSAAKTEPDQRVESEAQVVARLASLRRSSPTLWLVRRGGERYGQASVDRVVSRDFDELDRREFTEVIVQHIRWRVPGPLGDAAALTAVRDTAIARRGMVVGGLAGAVPPHTGRPPGQPEWR